MIKNAREVIVIGGGIAGLGAARELARGGCRVTLVEARERLGGRILTQRTSDRRRDAVEMGAEFIHGGNAELRALLRRAAIRYETVSREMTRLHEGRVVSARDFWKQTARIMGAIPAGAGGSFSRFLRGQRGLFSADELQRSRDYVESFNAAPAGKISVAALRAERGGVDQSQYRPRGGYGSAVKKLEEELGTLGVEILRDTEVFRIAWSRGKVSVHSRSARSESEVVSRAAAVVVTLPLGVLKAKAVKFVPRLKLKEWWVRKLGWGHVSRMTLKFRPAFFRQKVVGAAKPAGARVKFGFITAPGESFPVWWASASGPLVVGWAGGPMAERMLGFPPARLLTAALGSLAPIWGVSTKALRAQLSGCWAHDWSDDPFTRGAYSYPVAGHENGPAQLGKPVAGTLFFAGEATAEELGTVHGALASGIRAAKEVLRKKPRD